MPPISPGSVIPPTAAPASPGVAAFGASSATDPGSTLPASSSGLVCKVASAGDGANSEYDGDYQFLGMSSYGDVWAKVGDAITINLAGAIVGAGRAFVRAYYEIDQWRLSASGDWEVDESNGYLVQASSATALTPADVTEWLHASDSDITGTTVTLGWPSPGTVIPAPNAPINPASIL